MTDAAPGAPTQINLGQPNFEALTTPVSSAEVRAFRARVKAEQRANPSIRTGLTTATGIFAIVFLAFFVLVFAVVFGSTIIGVIAGGSITNALVPILFIVIFIVVAVIVVIEHFGAGGQWARWMRLSRFAADNALQFRTRSDNPNYSGMIFGLGDSRYAFDHFTSTSGRYFDFGDYEYGTGSGRDRQTHVWGFLAIHLDRNLPNMVLDSKENNSMFGSDLPESFNRSQILSLEGDFDQHFTLYCPQEYQTDALYVFTPDLMALLVDDAGSFDVEIVDDWMFVYSPKRFAALEPATYQRLFTIIRTIGAKAVSQTENYHDDRVASPTANIVAPQGQRLRHGTSIGALVIGGIFAVIWLFTVFHGFA